MAQFPYLDTGLPFEVRARDLVGRMTLDEKISQMVHGAPAIERLGIPRYNWWNECLHGVARAGLATVFPQAIGLAATFNASLVHRIASAISDEARAKHHDAVRRGNHSQYFGLTCWTPNINIFRDPRWGRGQETYGEDPHLTSRMGVAFVRGLQGDDPKYLKTVATPKHFAVHSGPEGERHSFDARVSGRDLRGTYLRAFEACIREGKAYSIMGAYNRLHGEPCCGSPKLLQKILREEWGFDGFVVSDCGAVCDFHAHHGVTANAAESAALAVKNGCDLECGQMYHRLRAAVQAGLVSEREIDTAVTRLVLARMKLGMFDPPEEVPYASIRPEVVRCREHVELARQAARESFVLLKNEGNLLPLSRNQRNIAIVGPCAYSLDVLHGNYSGYSPQMVTFLEGLIDALPVGTQVTYAKGCDVAGKRPVNEGEIGWVIGEAELIIAIVGYTPALEGEEGDAPDAQSEGGGDRAHLGLPGRQLELLQKLKALNKPLVVVLTGGSPIELNWAAENLPAILMTWYPGEQGGKALADVLFGDYSPAGRLPLTFVKSLEQVPDFRSYEMRGRTYRFLEQQPLFRFGYGLSYTLFAYGNLRLSAAAIRAGEGLEVAVDVANTGGRDSDEVVQAYLSAVDRSDADPIRELVAFDRVHIPAGQSRTVRLAIRGKQFASYAEDGKGEIRAGRYTISVGGGQPDDAVSGAVVAEVEIRA